MAETLEQVIKRIAEEKFPDVRIIGTSVLATRSARESCKAALREMAEWAYRDAAAYLAEQPDGVWANTWREIVLPTEGGKE